MHGNVRSSAVPPDCEGDQGCTSYRYTLIYISGIHINVYGQFGNSGILARSTRVNARIIKGTERMNRHRSTQVHTD